VGCAICFRLIIFFFSQYFLFLKSGRQCIYCSYVRLLYTVYKGGQETVVIKSERSEEEIFSFVCVDQGQNTQTEMQFLRAVKQ
jgi:hypothetical protein